MKDNYLTVSALTRYISHIIDGDPHLQNIWLKGEISNFIHHRRGHMYMTIKDENSQIKAAMFAGKNRLLKFRPENGMKVLIQGNVGVYEVNGVYQLYINAMEPDGFGSLFLAYEQLKQKLQKKGFFNPEFKKAIPAYPERIAVITSPTGAAVRDILTTIKRRYPFVEVIVIPVLVQGEQAAHSIQQAIQFASNSNMFDTIIVGRGGGSIEDLWSFNEEIVAEAIFEATTPIISAVGHETDTTISDLVADLRAPTPTSAAELAVPSQIEMNQRLKDNTIRLQRQMNRIVETEKKHLDHLKSSSAFRYPATLVTQKEQELDQKLDRLQRSFHSLNNEKINRFQTMLKRLELQHPEKQFEKAKQDLAQLETSKHRFMQQIVMTKQVAYQNILDKLTLVNPLSIMKRGFALPYQTDGKLIKSVNQIAENDFLTLKMSDGDLECQVLTKKENENEND